MRLYKLSDVKRTYSDRTVLTIDSLEIAPYQIYTLIGPNGAGKTTLLKILAFLTLPTTGTMQFMEHPVGMSEKHLHGFRKRVVLLDQNPIMFTGSVWQNIEFGLKIRKVVAKKRKERINEALELVGMERFIHYDAQELSGGETKRVALARALVLRPDVLLCDEPTANVDGENQEIILNIIQQVNRKHRTSVIFSTHYLSQGQRLADHTLLLQHGRLSDLANENIYKITIAGRVANTVICQLTGQLHLQLPIDLIPEAATKGKIYIDPSGIHLHPPPHLSEAIAISGHVLELSQQSGSVRISVDVGVRVNVTLPMSRYLAAKPGIGDKVQLSIPYRSIEFRELNPV